MNGMIEELVKEGSYEARRFRPEASKSFLTVETSKLLMITWGVDARLSPPHPREIHPNLKVSARIRRE